MEIFKYLLEVIIGYNNMLRNSPYASMYDNNGNYEQYPMSGLPTNGRVQLLLCIVSITIWKRGIPY